MELKPNRVVLTETDVFTIINDKSSTKLDLSFIDKKNHVDVSDLYADIELIKSRNFPLLRSVIKAFESGDIILCATENTSSSITFVYGTNSSKTQIIKVFANITRIAKYETVVDYKTGNTKRKINVVGGYEELYNILLAAYVGLNAAKAYRNPKLVTMIRNIYTDIFAQITSRSFGNPIDGEKFRFMVGHFFYNGNVSGRDLGYLTKYAPDRVQALELSHPDWFTQKTPISFNSFIDVIGKEFPTISRENLSPTSFVLSAVTSLGDNAVYILDNQAYLLSVIVAKARRSKLFGGYMLKTIEADASILLSSIYQSVM